MAVKYICDGCGAGIDDKPNEIGFVIHRHYCEKCYEVVQGYEEEMDAMHGDFATSWREQCALIRAKWASKVNVLPDFEFQPDLTATQAPGE